MRKTICLLLFCSTLMTSLFSQSSHDRCTDARSLSLSDPGFCPQASIVHDTFRFVLEEAAPTVPFPALGSCEPEQGLPDMWFQLSPNGNVLDLSLSGLPDGQFVLFAGLDCNNMYPIACGAGGGSLSAQAEVDPALNYYLLVGGDASDTPEFELVLSTAYDCSPCRRERSGFFTSTPAPQNGTFPGGADVEMCFTVARWGINNSPELFHALELELGPSWDAASLSPVVTPTSCSNNGEWGWYDSWESEASGNTFGPGFAYDTFVQDTLDGDPGNNLGVEGPICGNIGFASPQLQFCWSLRTPECPQGESTLLDGLDVNLRMLGDGNSGSRENTDCTSPPVYTYQASVDCYDPLAPTIEVTDASCGSSCDGSIFMAGGGEGPWDYILSDSNNVLVLLSTSLPASETAEELCPGDYYVVIIDNASGTTHTDTVTVGSTPAPTASASYQLPCFEGKPIRLFGEASPEGDTATYAWEGPNGFSSDAQNPLALFPGTYSLVATVDGCASEPFSLEVPPVDENVAAIEADTLVGCPDDSLTLAAEGSGTSFDWFELNSGAFLGSGQSIQVLPENGQVYQVNGSNPQGCTGSDQVAVVVNFSPALESSTEEVVCAGDPVTLTASGGSEYDWSSGDTTAAIDLTPQASGTYQVTISGENSCSSVLGQSIQVASGAGLSVSPDATICAGESVTLSSNGAESQLWSSGDTTALVTVSPDSSATYAVVQTDVFGCTYSDSVSVTVNPDPGISLLPEDTTVCSGDSVQLSLLQGDSIIWDTLVAPLQHTSYGIPFDFGCASTPVFNVSVAPQPSVSIIPPPTLCSEDDLLLVADTQAPNVVWSNGVANDSLYVNPDTATVYSVTATNAAGCSDQDEIIITPLSPPDPPVIDCAGGYGQVTFSWPVDTSLTYSLIPIEGPLGTPAGSNQYVVNGLAEGDSVSVELQVTDANGCTNSSTATCSPLSCDSLSLELSVPDAVCDLDGSVALSAEVLNGDGSGSGQWSGPGVDPATETFDPNATGEGSFELIYEYEAGSCRLSDTANIMVEQAFSAMDISCEASANEVLFSWEAQAQDTAYELLVLSGQAGEFDPEGPELLVDGLETGDTVSIAVTALGEGPCGAVSVEASCVAEAIECPELAVAADTFICEGASAQLWADSLNWTEFSWSPAIELSCLDCPSPEASPLATTTYTVVASNEAGCQDTASVTVYIEDLPASYIPDTPVIYCPGEPFELCMPEGDLHYWIGPNAYIEANRCLTLDPATADQGGRYFAFMRKGGCRFIKPVILAPAPPIEVDEITDFQTVCPNDTFQLAASSEEAVSYSWNLGEYLSCPTCPETAGSVPQTATFTVTVADIYGCTASANATVFVEDCSNLPLWEGESPAAAASLLVFPNPAKERAELLTSLKGRKEAQLWGLDGRLYRRHFFEGQRSVLPVENLPSGQYLLRVIGDKETEQAKLLVE